MHRAFGGYRIPAEDAGGKKSSTERWTCSPDLVEHRRWQRNSQAEKRQMHAQRVHWWQSVSAHGVRPTAFPGRKWRRISASRKRLGRAGKTAPGFLRRRSSLSSQNTSRHRSATFSSPTINRASNAAILCSHAALSAHRRRRRQSAVATGARGLPRVAAAAQLCPVLH